MVTFKMKRNFPLKAPEAPLAFRVSWFIHEFYYWFDGWSGGALNQKIEKK